MLATLFAGAFAAGCAEMLAVGVLDLPAISIKQTPGHQHTTIGPEVVTDCAVRRA